MFCDEWKSVFSIWLIKCFSLILALLFQEIEFGHALNIYYNTIYFVLINKLDRTLNEIYHFILKNWHISKNILFKKKQTIRNRVSQTNFK